MPVKTVDKSKVLGIVYDVSDSGATTFIEPMEIVQINNEMTSLKVEENEEIRKILKGLTALVLIQEKEILHNNAVIGELDFLTAKALYANEINGIVAEHCTEPYVDLVEARHPLIDPRKVVSNSYHLDQQERIVVISGPNAGGKTVALKTLGLMIMMNQMGLALPTLSPANLGFFPKIYADMLETRMKAKKAGVITQIVILILIIYAAVTLVTLRRQVSEAAAYQAELQQTITDLEVKNSQLEYSLKHSGDSDVLEEIARDELGLVGPNDKVFYDSGK